MITDMAIHYPKLDIFFWEPKKKGQKGQQKQIPLGKHGYYFDCEPTEFVGFSFFFLSQLRVMYRYGGKFLSVNGSWYRLKKSTYSQNLLVKELENGGKLRL